MLVIDSCLPWPLGHLSSDEPVPKVVIKLAWKELMRVDKLSRELTALKDIEKACHIVPCWL